jgi:outer membrane protein assembly factor BamD (BamD/ComL family)
MTKHPLRSIFFLTAFLIYFSAGCVSTGRYSGESASSLYHKGLQLFNKGRYEDAKEVFHAYISDYAGTELYPVSLYYLGFCYQKLNDVPQAVSIYHKVIDENEGDFWAQMARTRVQELESH